MTSLIGIVSKNGKGGKLAVEIFNKNGMTDLIERVILQCSNPIDNEYMKITYVAAGTDKQTIDIDQLAKEEPDLYSDLLKDYPKTTKGRKAYIMFKVKDKE